MALWKKRSAEPSPAPAVEEPAASPVGEVVVEATPEKPARKGSLATSIGKGITLANFVIALLAVSTSFFFHAQKIQVRQRKSELEQITRQLSQLQQERQGVVDALKQESELEEQRLATVTKAGQDEIGKLEAQIAETRQKIEDARKDQSRLSDESDKMQAEQAELIKTIQGLRATLESTLGEKEAQMDERRVVEDQLAKVQNNLREALRRQREVADRLASLASAQ